MELFRRITVSRVSRVHCVLEEQEVREMIGNSPSRVVAKKYEVYTPSFLCFLLIFIHRLFLSLLLISSRFFFLFLLASSSYFFLCLPLISSR